MADIYLWTELGGMEKPGRMVPALEHKVGQGCVDDLGSEIVRSVQETWYDSEFPGYADQHL